ncbi:MAG: hypothetical protein ACLFV7_12065 [Phycisphaerae bacterium]
MLRKLCCVLAATALFASLAIAGLTEVSAPCSIADIQAGDGTYTVGELTFSEVDAVTSASPSAVHPDIEGIYLVGVRNDATGRLGLKIVGDSGQDWAWWARWRSADGLSGEVIQTKLTYKVSAGAGRTIAGNSLGFVQADAETGASVLVSGHVYPSSDRLAGEDQSYTHVAWSTGRHSDSELLAESTPEAWVTDEIEVSSDPHDAYGMLNSFYHIYQVIPEPVVLSIMTVGGLGLLASGRRRK